MRTHNDVTLPAIPKRVLSTRDAAEFLGLSQSTLEKYRTKGDGPEYIAVSRRMVRYEESALVAWLEGKKSLSTADAIQRGLSVPAYNKRKI